MSDDKRRNLKKWGSLLFFVLGLPLLLWGGSRIFDTKQYAFVSLILLAAACVPFLLSFEHRRQNVVKLILLALLTAISVVGRLLFSVLPGFKPVTAIVVLAAMSFGGEFGFMTGALSALLSNLYFGQGPWTPFQMFAWGMLGFLAGLLAVQLKRSKILLSLYGIFAGIVFSLLMDIWTVLWMDGTFNLIRYGTVVLSSFGFMAIYAVSNVIFLLLLAKPIGRKLDRIKEKYGL